MGKIVVKFFANFREITGKNKIEIAGSKDIGLLLDELVEKFGPKFAEQIYEPEMKKLLNRVHILVNGRDIDSFEGLNTHLRDGDVVAIFPPVGGGRLTPDELERYNRQIIIRDFGKAGQRKLKRARVLVAGLGGLGSPAAVYLVAAGVGHLTLLDAERVELSNLNRQVLHWHSDVKSSKVGSAVQKLRAMNPTVEINSKLEKITPKNVDGLLKDIDVVIDGMDNYPTRYLLNEACVRACAPFIHGAVEGFVGQLSTILPGKGPCLRCIFPKEPPQISKFPVLGTTPGIIGCLQAMEAIKLFTGIGKPLVGRMLFFNGRDATFDEIEVRRNPNCPVCKGV